MQVIVVRHACAGRKEAWAGLDEERPLDAAGVVQAAALRDALDGVDVRRLVSSPTRRCVDTLAPLAVSHGLAIETSPGLSPDASMDGVVDLLTDARSAGAVLCTHGETMALLLGWLRLHCLRPPASDDDRLLAKGTGWMIDLDEDVPVAWRHVAPMAVEDCLRHPLTRTG